MCGISGYILKKKIRAGKYNTGALIAPLEKRGPDDEGVCLISRPDKGYKLYRTDRTVETLRQGLDHIDDNDKIIEHDAAFLHTRYSIIDLTPNAHQPFVSGDESIVGIFNGEIYNYIELRDELSSLGVKFKTSSDTEVLVEGYNYWKEELWSKMNGFWAVALYDVNAGTITFSRDRIGVAPLYYYENEEGFFFASYIQPLLNVAGENVTFDQDVISGFAKTGIKDHDNTTFYSGIKSVPASTFVIFSKNDSGINSARETRFWDLPKKRLEETDISFKDAVEQYREVFFGAVELRLRADVKVAFELSGGLDSSSIVAAASLISGGKISTYTAKVKGADEEPFARAMLKYYPVDYNVISKIEDNFADDCVEFSKLMEEPYDNPNVYTHNRMLRQIKEKGVGVIITGAGGDEVLAGYESSFWPKAYKELKGKGLKGFLDADWYEFCRRYKTNISSYRTLRHYLVDPVKMVFRNSKKTSSDSGAVSSSASLYQKEYREMSFHERTLFHFKVALVPYYMRSSDHFTMGIPIEHRFPFLDYRVVEFGLKMPITYLFRNGWTKYILRKAMEPYLPKKIVWRRKKMGFTFSYRRYFTANKEKFRPMLETLQVRDPLMMGLGRYDDLLKRDPLLLWRLLSIAIWSENKPGIVSK